MNFVLNWINLAVLLGAVIIPFPTAVLAGAFAEGADNDKRVAVVLYALAAAFMSAAWLAAFSYLSRHPELLQSGTTPRYARQQLGRPLTGIGLYAISGLAGWFISPIAGLICILIMITYHAITSEGLQEGPLGRLARWTGDRRCLSAAQGTAPAQDHPLGSAYGWPSCGPIFRTSSTKIGGTFGDAARPA